MRLAFARWSAVVALVSACGDEQPPPNGEFVAMRANVTRQVDDVGEVMISLRGDFLAPCPHLEEPISVHVNGFPGEVGFPGGLSSDDPMYATCQEADLEVFGFRLDDRVSIAIDSANLTMRLEWRGVHRLWTDADIVAAMETRDPFEVNWTPESADLPLVELSANTGTLADPTVVLEETGPGWARYHIEGGDPPADWKLSGSSMLIGEPLADCPLAESCLLDSYADLLEP